MKSAQLTEMIDEADDFALNLLAMKAALSDYSIAANGGSLIMPFAMWVEPTLSLYPQRSCPRLRVPALPHFLAAGLSTLKTQLAVLSLLDTTSHVPTQHQWEVIGTRC